MKKVIICSPIRQKNNILKEFLISLDGLSQEGVEYTYYFVDDNVDEKSSMILNEFKKKHNVILKKGSELYEIPKTEYFCGEDTHVWKKDLILKITHFKNQMIKYAEKNNFDYLFFVDSDLILYPNLIQHLISRGVDIVSEVFWTRFFAGCPMEPQVWLQDSMNRYVENWDSPLTFYEKEQQKINFETMLRFPGIYEVGGLGACTLISKKAINAGVSFNLIDNVSFWGEDRHFCIRAESLGFKLYVDTVYPAYHIYREIYLNGVEEYKKNGWSFNMCQEIPNPPKESKFKYYKKIVIRILKKIKVMMCINKKNKFNRKRLTENNKVVLSMVVHNESGRYLEKVIHSVKDCIDAAVIIDDASTDDTVDLLEKLLEGKEHVIIKNKRSMFKKEYKLRRKQWKETLKLNPGWVLSLDADEVLEDNFFEKMENMKKISNIDVYRFRLYDMWNETEYREDRYWHAHNIYRPFLVRYQPKFKYRFKRSNQHCGRLPKNIKNLTAADVDVKIKHFGWAREEDRKQKYDRYMKLDKNCKDGDINQYKSIMDENPNLKKFDV